METFGGNPLADVPIGGSPTALASDDSVTLTAITETNTLVALSSVEFEVLSPVSETTILQALVTSDHSDPRLFYWPTVDGYQVKPLVAPLWEMHFYEVDTETPKQVASDVGFFSLHTNPVKVDRYGNIPTIFVDSAKSYRFVLKNEFGVTKWEAGSYTWPNTVEDHIELSPITETTSMVALTTAEI